MAKGVQVASDTSTAPKKTRRSSGPKKVKPFHVVFRSVDAGGNVIEGAKLEVGLISKNTENVLDFMDANGGKGYSRQKIDVPVSETSRKPAA